MTDTNHRPVRTTIVFGLFCGLAFIPLSTGLSILIYFPRAFAITLWLFVAVYSILLARIARKKMTDVFFPLIVLFLLSISGQFYLSFIVMSAGVLSWVRSGICFKGRRFLIAEMITFFPGAAALVCFMPHSAVTWALSIWLFFLVQSLYFNLTDLGQDRSEKSGVDDFEQAKRAAERILSERPRILF
ncbi:MAG: hypothetical protein KJ737_07430 [Proteobacteria bacterium]|nr:hypothetical protein [Pseudomonadota bacterium]